MKTLIFLILLSILFTGCSGFSDAETVDDNKIMDILTDLEIAFNSSDLESIYNLYHPGFLHDGNSMHEERILWQIRVNDFSVLKIENISIEYLESYKAVVSFDLKLGKTDYSCPDEIGDFSYFINENGEWHIYGNHL